MSMLAIADLWNYYVVIFLMMAGLFVVISRQNLVKKLVGLSIFQTSVFLFYITLGKMAGGTAPILMDDPSAVYSNPLPHVLILTAIVVGVATTALGLALVLRINEAFGSIEEGVLLAAKAEAALERPNRRRTAVKDSKHHDS
ncbi:cation:proton antiporter subunit C [Candidatus Puniceispirillum sp.]|jgi:multicomponent Na+:H+ antiporter subunit C|uniref:cation:proton antiporter subunit C n=1 Tax=Candidatus Puniceispirillum sp. TaxID=2026719 RepID=UPI001EB112B7|nr:cation:proton antiporter subunit C [Candidatus Puniceispirillum sp.]